MRVIAAAVLLPLCGGFVSQLAVPRHSVGALRRVPSTVGALCGRPTVLRMSVNTNTAEVASIIEKMESWITCITPDGHSKRHVRYTVSGGTTLSEVFADFWKAVSDCVDEHRAAGEYEPFRLLHMVVAPFCKELEDYDTMQKVDQLFTHCATAGGCEDFGKPITVLHYHPNFRNSKPDSGRQSFRHSPFPAFSLNVFYRAGGMLANTAPPPPPPVGRRAQPPQQLPRQQQLPPQQQQQQFGGPSSARKRPPGDKAQGGRPKAGKGERSDKDKEWVQKTRSSLEALYNRAAASSSIDRVDTHGAPDNDIPESSQEILEATQTWIRQVTSEAADAKNSAYPSAAAARYMEDVAQCVVTRSKAAENIYADIWEAIVELVRRARNVGCDVAGEYGANGAPGRPCTSAVLVTPEFSTFNAELFKKFGESVNRALRHLPSPDDVTVEIYHPEFVGEEKDKDAFHRSPYPTIHIRYHGLRSEAPPQTLPSAAASAVLPAESNSAAEAGAELRQQHQQEQQQQQQSLSDGGADPSDMSCDI